MAVDVLRTCLSACRRPKSAGSKISRQQHGAKPLRQLEMLDSKTIKSLETILKARGPGMFMSLLLLCSCAAQNPVRHQLPAPVTINKEAGRGGHLTVTLRLENGKELPFDVDTGAPFTVFNKSLEPQLGKCLGQTSLNWWNGREESHIYAAPRLYLGGTPLLAADRIFTSDLKRMGPQTMGVLGMDCLKHYCIQLDFAAGEMRFLDPAGVNAAGLGRAFPLTFSGIGSQSQSIHPTIHQGGLVGEGTNLLIDTGCNIDGLVSEGTIKGIAVLLPECGWEGETFTNLIIAAVDHASALGLSFLARHLVTLDFPNRMLYLKQTSIGPLAGDIMMEIARSDHREILEAYKSLREKDQLPGLSKDDDGAVYLESNSGSGFETVMFDFQKKGDLSTFHYKAGRSSVESIWKLQKAWRTDQNGHTIEEYPVP